MWKLLKSFRIPAILLFSIVSFAGFMAWKECKIENTLVEEALRGNRHAIAILAKYEKPWKLNEQVLQKAIAGNPYALEVLKIAPEPTVK